MKRQQVNNVLNIKNSEGIWLKGYSIEGVRYQCRSCILWNNINIRCKPQGAHQERRPTYIGTVNEFESFHMFTDWCESSFGLYFKNKSNNEFWALDKDISLVGNKSYNSNNCLFVPKSINALFTNRQNHRGNCPLGVTKVKRKFNSSLEYFSHAGTSSSKGFSTALDAHRYWQEEKIKSIEYAIKNDEIVGHSKLIDALEYRVQYLMDDYNNFRETKTF